MQIDDAPLQNLLGHQIRVPIPFQSKFSHTVSSVWSAIPYVERNCKQRFSARALVYLSTWYLGFFSDLERRGKQEYPGIKKQQQKKNNPHMAFFSNSTAGHTGRRQITCFLHCASLVTKLFAQVREGVQQRRERGYSIPEALRNSFSGFWATGDRNVAVNLTPFFTHVFFVPYHVFFSSYSHLDLFLFSVNSQSLRDEVTMVFTSRRSLRTTLTLISIYKVTSNVNVDFSIQHFTSYFTSPH